MSLPPDQRFRDRERVATTPFPQDLAVCAAVFGVAAFVWFGWAQEAPPARWRPPLGLGSALGVLLAVVGGLLAWRVWGTGMAMAHPQARLVFGIVGAVEVGASGLGSAALALTGRSRWIAPWIAGVVGAHFVPLALL